MSAGESKRTLVGLVPSRLAVGAEHHRLPWKPGDDHERGVKLALDWQQAAGSAAFWEMGAVTRGASESMVYAFAGLMASAGEQLGLAHASSMEVALWNDTRDEEGFDPEHEMCMRAMAEMQTLFVTGTGHALANLAARALALRPSLRRELAERLGPKKAPPGFDPFSDARVDWLSLNGSTCRTLRAVAEVAQGEEVTQLVAPVVEFGTGPAWTALQDRRGQDFHRWRPQTHGIEGVSRASPWELDGLTRSIGGGRRPYQDAAGLADQAADLARRAMLELVDAMEAFKARWLAASEHLGGPKFTTPPGSEWAGGEQA